jgi:hypothetical protein
LITKFSELNMKPFRKVSNQWTKNWLSIRMFLMKKQILSKANPCQKFLKKNARLQTAFWNKPNRTIKNQWRSVARDSVPTEITYSSKRTIRGRMSLKSSRLRRQPSRISSENLKRWTPRLNLNPLTRSLINRCKI